MMIFLLVQEESVSTLWLHICKIVKALHPAFHRNLRSSLLISPQKVKYFFQTFAKHLCFYFVTSCTCKIASLSSQYRICVVHCWSHQKAWCFCVDSLFQVMEPLVTYILPPNLLRCTLGFQKCSKVLKGAQKCLLCLSIKNFPTAILKSA